MFRWLGFVASVLFLAGCGGQDSTPEPVAMPQKEKTWVKDWMKIEDIKTGIPDLIKSNIDPIIYALMAGLSLAAVGLTWKGYAYVIVILTVYLAIQLLLDRFRNTDSLGVLMIYFLTVGFALLVIYPYYHLSIQIPSWYDTPTIMFAAAMAGGIVLVVTRKLPWLLVILGSIAIFLVGLLILELIVPEVVESIMGAVASGAGYFVRNKQYETIAEAQAPAAVQEICDAAKKINSEVIVLCHGGPISMPDDAEYVLQNTDGVHGFYGASSMERLPTEIAIAEQMKKFKAIRFK